MTRLCAIAFVALVACSDEERPQSGAIEELRVSTHRRLDPPVPPTGETTSAGLFDLVCNSAFDRRVLRPDLIELRPRGSPVGSLDELAKLVRHVDLDSAAVVGDTIQVTLRRAGDPRLLCVENGPYRVTAYSPSEVLLERRTGDGVKRIRVISVRDSEEEWRRFLAREVDVVPSVNRSQLRYLRELESVKLTEVVAPSIGLTFNVRTVPYEVRRTISLAINRKAIVRALALDDARAVAGEEDVEAAATLLGGRSRPLRVLTFQGDADMRRSALVVEENLSRLGFSPTVVVEDLANMVGSLKRGDYDVWLFLVSYTARGRWGLFRTGNPNNTTGFSDPEFDAAADAGDAKRVKAIIDRQVLLVPLFNVADVIASDHRLCGIVKPDLVDLTWLAGVHSCALGGTE